MRDKTGDNSTQNRSVHFNPEEWVQKHGDVLFGYALRYLSDPSEAEDLVQETLLAALKGQGTFAGISSERTWLISILKNKAIDRYRKSGRENQMLEPGRLAEPDDADFILTGPDTGSWQPDRRPSAWSINSKDPVERQQFWDHLQNCLGGLDERLAKVYNLRDIQEIEYGEICNLLSVKPTNLRVLLHRARKLLRRCLEIHWIKS